jgi:hypothetical protein
MSWKTRCLLVAVVATAAGCATNQQQQPVNATSAPAVVTPKAATVTPKIAPATNAKTPANVTGNNTGTVAGTIAPGSKFSKVKLGMQFEAVNELIGTPNSLSRNETGKRWIPFYFGSDVLRLQASYKGEGCLTYTGGNQFGSSGGELIAITVDPAGCV